MTNPKVVNRIPDEYRCVIEGCEGDRRFPRVKEGRPEVCHDHATLPYPDGPWTEKQEQKLLAMGDVAFLDEVAELPLGMYVTGHYDVTGDVLFRLQEMARAAPVLREVEWKGADKTCPSCGGFKPGEPKPTGYESGHYEGCLLAAALYPDDADESGAGDEATH